MSGIYWPNFNYGQPARASEVEARFDWIEGNVYPHDKGTKSNNLHDIGNGTYKWRNLYCNNLFSTQLQGDSGASIALFDTDGTFSADSDARVPTQKAFKTFADNTGAIEYQYTISCLALASGYNAGTAYNKVPFSSELYDYASNFDTSNYNFLAPTSGYYYVSLYMRINKSTGTSGLSGYATVSKNSTTLGYISTFQNQMSNTTSALLGGIGYLDLQCSGVLSLASGDTLSAYISITQTPTSTWTTTISGTFSVQRVKNL